MEEEGGEGCCACEGCEVDVEVKVDVVWDEGWRLLGEGLGRDAGQRVEMMLSSGVSGAERRRMRRGWGISILFVCLSWMGHWWM